MAFELLEVAPKGLPRGFKASNSLFSGAVTCPEEFERPTHDIPSSVI